MSHRICEDKVVWGVVSDEMLKAFGARDSINVASSAILSEMRQWHMQKDHGLIVSHPSVLSPIFSDDVHHIDELVSWHTRVAMGQEPRASSADRLCCALDLLYIASTDRQKVEEAVVRDAQRVISSILLEFPVLLHPRLTIGSAYTMFASHGEVVTVLASMNRTGLCEMPSVRHGCDAASVERFAKSQLLNAPFKRTTPKKACWPHPDRRSGRKVSHQGVGLYGTAPMGNDSSAGFVGSLLELTALRGIEPGKLPAYFSGAQRSALTSTCKALSMATGMWHHISPVFVGGGYVRQPGLPWFTKALLDSGLFEDERLELEVFRLMSRTALIPWNGLRRDNEIGPSEEMVSENVRQCLIALSEVGLAKGGVRQTAEKLYLALRDERRGDTLPQTNTAGAMGFMRAMVEAGYQLPEEPPKLRSGEDGAPDVSNAARWAVAHQVWSRTQTMEQVIQAHKPETGQEPTSRRRARVL